MEIKIIIVILTLVLTTSLGKKNATSVLDKPPLHLTPLIDNGKMDEARQRSLIIDTLVPRSHAGLITVDKQHGNHLFFWFFPAVNVSSRSPLLVWLGGDPGLTSMAGLLFDTGPIRVKLHGTSGPTNPKTWEHSWSEKFNMLYIDQPVGVGYSYTEDELHGYRITQDGMVKDLYEFMTQFYVLFPEFMSRELYIGGHSYAGKYVPAFAFYLHTEILAGASCIPLKGIFLAAPFFDPETQFRKASKLYEALGVISKKQAADIDIKFGKFVELGNYANKKTDDIYYMTIPEVGIPPSLLNNYLVMHPYKVYRVNHVVKTPVMRDLLHVGKLTFNANSSDVYNSFSHDLMVSSKSKLAILMDSYKVLVYNGDMDGVVGSMTIDASLMSTQWKLQEDYNNSARSIWRLAGKVAGFYTKTGQFCRVVIHGAGHFTSRDRPEASKDMIEQFVEFGCMQ